MTPKTISLSCTVDGKPLSGSLVSVTLRMKRKNDFHLVFGPTDSQGNVVIVWDELLTQAHREVQLAGMDYGNPETETTGGLVIEALNLPALDRAIRAADIWESSLPANWKQTLDSCKAVLNALPPSSVIKISGQLHGNGFKLLFRDRLVAEDPEKEFSGQDV